MKTVDSQPQRVLPADVYDTLELSALAFGGIGRSAWFEYVDHNAPDVNADGNKIPLCVHGHAAFAVGAPYPSGAGPISSALRGVGITIGVNDAALRMLGLVYGDSRRVSWKQYVKALNIVRGDN